MITESLEALRNNFYDNAPKEIIQTIENHFAELVEDKLVENALKVGDLMPEFELRNSIGEVLSSKTLLSEGPIVLNFYRGAW
ncbi:MAG: peroxiredoxin family protein [Firmicutes bacterium]|jgi:hypothetical protein|nr:peroxiredoxin family protein [Bacillota bacterium]